MSAWFRFYEGVLDDPKVQTLPAEDFKAWVNILCAACRGDGTLPETAALSFILRISLSECETLIERLVNAGLIDRRNGGPNGSRYAPHAWDKRQYKSDSSTQRVKRFRKRPTPVAETPPDTDTDTDTESKKRTEAKEASAAGAPVVSIDAKTALFREGLSALSAMTGRPADGLRSVLGRWLKLTGDNYAAVLALIQRAKEHGVIEPIAWIEAGLKPKDPDEAIYRGVL